jgi:hypothetical protein
MRFVLSFSATIVLAADARRVYRWHMCAYGRECLEQFETATVTCSAATIWECNVSRQGMQNLFPRVLRNLPSSP